MKKIIAALMAAVLVLTGMAAAFGEGVEIWRKGDSGEKVTWIQTRLIELEYLEGDPSGVFDDATEEALQRFQRENSLLVTGMGDETTLNALAKCTTKARKADAWSWLFGDYEEACTEAATGTVNYYAPVPAATSSAAMKYTASDSMGYFNTEEYTTFRSNRFLSTRVSPLSTFAADVDTSSYALLRRKILGGERVPADSVRIEEMLNYFHYDYKQPEGDEPFGVTITCAPCPWNEKTQLLQIGLQAKVIEAENRPGHNLVFLIDTSGSMNGDDRLGLVKRAFLMLLDDLEPEDTVSIVTYASRDRVVIEGVPAREKTQIMEAINDLQAHGSTNGSAGIMRAYEIAEKYLLKDGVNRILLATDGDLNVGVTSEGDLARLVEEKREGGVSLTCLGFGLGNYKDNKMEALADYGNGNCWYIDTIHEARKALVTEGGGTFITVAKDVKIQVDFNPVYVSGYRLIGYEDRLLAAEDFANDAVDGGEIGSGHRMTALYEIVPAGSDFDFGDAESRYSTPVQPAGSRDMLTVSIRAKEPDGDTSRLYEYPVSAEIVTKDLDDNMKFAAAVIETGMILRGSEWKGTATYESALELLRSCGTVSGDSYKEEFVYMVNLLERGN